MRLTSFPWLRWFGEFVVIVLGILGAFAVDEYRETQRDHEVADEYLEQLVQDLVNDRHHIVTSEQRVRAELQTADQMLLLLGADLEDYWNQVPFYESPVLGQFEKGDIDAAYLGEFETFQPYTATYTSIVSNGDLRTIADATLRRAIVSYYEGSARRNRDRDEFYTDAVRLKELLLRNGIDLHEGGQVDQVLAIEGLQPVLAAARDSSHWRLARILLIKLNQQMLMNALLDSERLSDESIRALREVLYLSREDARRPAELDWNILVAPGS